MRLATDRVEWQTSAIFACPESLPVELVPAG
jgi:hypothetical protein